MGLSGLPLQNFKTRHLSSYDSSLLQNSLVPKPNNLPKSHYEAKSLIQHFGLRYNTIHACKNGCVLYKNLHSAANNALFVVIPESPSWPATLQPPCLGREPKVRVATSSIGIKQNSPNIDSKSHKSWRLWATCEMVVKSWCIFKTKALYSLNIFFARSNIKIY